MMLAHSNGSQQLSIFKGVGVQKAINALVGKGRGASRLLQVSPQDPESIAAKAKTAMSDEEIFDFQRGDMIFGFDPECDILEIEYSAAKGVPHVTVSTSPDDSGVLISMNGAVMAEIIGIDALDRANIVLLPV